LYCPGINVAGWNLLELTIAKKKRINSKTLKVKKNKPKILKAILG